ncbi:MAG: metal ABC transporter ATP-binding protein [Candidatus Bathyarchaeota archaeon]|nr:metal ABC transporter ATP-binding protein [Candidatus Bathyarchaeota archaeon]
MPETSIIMLENVSTVYEGETRPSLKGINLTFKKNDLVYIVGPNASGKTTLIETINGLLPSFKGKVTIFGLDLKSNGKKIRCQIGYVPQDFMVKPEEPYKALDVVLMGKYGQIGFLHQPEDKDKQEALEAMKLIGIEDLADKAMGKLSGGQQQKVMLARALAKKPKILLLDEPFSNLDPDSRGQIPLLITKLHEEQDLTTLIVTHDIHHMLDQCNRVVVITGSKVTFDGTPDEALPIFESHPHTTKLEGHHN